MICYIHQAQFQFCSKVCQYSQHYFCCFAETSSCICHLRLSNVLGLVTVISHCYKKMRSSFLESVLRHCKVISITHGTNKMGWLLIQQRPTMNVVREMFHSTLLHGTAMLNGLHIHLICVCDHFLYGPLKSKVYTTRINAVSNTGISLRSIGRELEECWTLTFWKIKQYIM